MMSGFRGRLALGAAMVAASLGAVAHPADDAISSSGPKTEREKAADKARSAAAREAKAAKRKLTDSDRERLRLAAERRARKIARQAKGFVK